MVAEDGPGPPESPTLARWRTWRQPPPKRKSSWASKVRVNIKTFADGHTPPDRVIPSQL